MEACVLRVKAESAYGQVSWTRKQHRLLSITCWACWQGYRVSAVGWTGMWRLMTVSCPAYGTRTGNS